MAVILAPVARIYGASMKAWQLEQLSLSGLVQRDLPMPQPKGREVVVRIRATSVNPRDVGLAIGAYGPQALPLVPLADGAGEVVAIGPEVTRVAVGARVIGTFVHGWISGPPRRELAATVLGGPRPGTLAEFAVFEDAGVVVIPEALTFDEAATLPIAGATAWQALFGDAPVRPGQTVVVQGTGGVAMFAIQLAAAAGARVIALSSSDDKLAIAGRHGAVELVNYTTTPAWDERVRALTAGDGADLVVDTSGELRRSVAATRPGGQVSVVGLLAGARTEIEIVPLLVNHIRLQGIQTGNRTHLEQLVAALVANAIHPVIDRAYDFDAAPRAFAAIAERERYVGKLVIRGA